MIASGEMAGKLEESLEQIVTQMKKGYALTSSIKGAMIYPAVIVFAITAVAIIMVTTVLPKLTSMFDEFEADLPLATKVLIAITDFMSKPLNLVLLFGAIVGLIALFIFSLKKFPGFKDKIHSLNLKLPIFGQVIKQINLARFSLTLSSLLKSTLPIVEAIDITGDTCSNVKYQNVLHRATEKVKTGVPLSEILMEEEKLFPPMVTEMIMVGEKTGEIDRLLDELSDFYSEEVDKTMKNFSTIIEPVIIILLGLAVAGIAVAVVMPMFSLMQNF
ncbi:type II secretion system F family protein [Candidatus Parcubacteria bacterium]|nr:type II secretion system F family protein [Candidatus Parcubacteria bacterium]